MSKKISNLNVEIIFRDCLFISSDEKNYSMEDIEDKALKIFNAMFNDQETVEIEGETYYFDRTPKLGLKLIRISEYKFLEQNPEKDSSWGEKASGGHKIMWVLKDEDYIAQVHDWEFRDWG